jgi:hypothetical protein
MEFLSSLSLLQWATIGIGIYLLLSGTINFSQLLEWFKKQSSKSKDVDLPVSNNEDAEGYSLVQLVAKWDDLMISCDKAGCVAACQELEKVFPLLAPNKKGGTPNEG